MRADIGNQVATSRKPQHADLARIDVVLRGMKADQADGPLRILESHWGYRIHLALALPIPMWPGIRDAVFQKHAGDSLGCQPVADLRPFQVDRQDEIAAAGKHNYRGARVLCLRREDGHRGP